MIFEDLGSVPNGKRIFGRERAIRRGGDGERLGDLGDLGERARGRLGDLGDWATGRLGERRLGDLGDLGHETKMEVTFPPCLAHSLAHSKQANGRPGERAIRRGGEEEIGRLGGRANESLKSPERAINNSPG